MGRNSYGASRDRHAVRLVVARPLRRPRPDDARYDVARALDATLAPSPPGRAASFIGISSPATCSGCRTGPAPARIGILDFQSAALGHPVYDLVSLVQDARRDIQPAAAERAVIRYLAARPEHDPDRIPHRLAACAAQRHLRVACQWVRLAARDGRPQYLAHGPRTWRLLNEALRHPAAAPLAAALNRWLPASLRGNPPELTTAPGW